MMDRLDALEQRVADLERRLAPLTEEQAEALMQYYRDNPIPVVPSSEDMATVEIKPGSLRVREFDSSVIPWWRDQWEEGV